MSFKYTDKCIDLDSFIKCVFLFIIFTTLVLNGLWLLKHLMHHIKVETYKQRCSQTDSIS